MYLLVLIAIYVVSNAVHIVYTSQLSLTKLGLF